MLKKKTTTHTDNDKQLMMQAMDAVINGNFTPIDTSSFTDKAYADKLNQLI